jgi:glycosyltransferase involved in cell wall biosynthesis
MTAADESRGEPAVSVILTCYNLGRYLGEAVDSVLAQSFRDFELVIVDDGSTDDETCRRLDDYQRQAIRVIRSANRGLPAARNLGIAHTRGRYVCAVDADDVLEPALLERSVSVLESDPSVAFVSHWLRAFGDETWEWTPSLCDFPALLDTNTVNGAAVVRREILSAIGGFDETMRDGCEDWDLWITIVERGGVGRILPEFLFNYRRRRESMSRVMLAGDTHPQLYRRLVEKHVDTYRAHLSHLLIRRERHVAHLDRQILDLELEQARWLMPELAKHRDDVTVLERRAERNGQWQALVADRDRLQALLAAAESSLDRLRASLASAESARAEADPEGDRAIAAEKERTHALDLATARAYELDARAHRAEAEVAALRASLSWRLTKPLRALASGFKPPAGRQS